MGLAVVALPLAALQLPVAGAPQEPLERPSQGSLDDEAARAAMARFEWSEETVASLRDFFERTHVDEILDGLTEPVARSVGIDEALASLAAGDWLAPFRYVQRQIAFVPYRGAVRGALGTLATGAGNALDQTLLLRELYRARGMPTRLVRGTLRWDDAVRLVGTPPGRLPGRGDPWLRWVEATADHWWLEVRHDGRWQPLDAAFVNASPGSAVGRRRGVVDEVPPQLRTHGTVLVVGGERTLLRRSVAVAELLFRPVELAVEPLQPSQEPAMEEATEAGGHAAASARSSVEAASAGAAGGASTDAAAAGAVAEQADPLAPVLPRYGDGPLTLRLSFGDSSFRIEGVRREELGGVRLIVRVRPPGGPGSMLELPWTAEVDGHLLVLAAVGPVPRALRVAAVRPVWELLQELAEAEQTALAAWEARPQPEASGAGVVHRIPPPPPPEDRGEADASSADEARQLHPAMQLQVAAVTAWLRFERFGLRSLAMLVAAAADELRPPTVSSAGGVHLVGLAWQPPGAARPSRLSLWNDDPVMVGGVAGDRRRGWQAARGILESALVGHVINGFADRPPVTAFDVTLRMVGSGNRLAWWRVAAGLPETWPAAARAAAAAELRRGYLVVAPPMPLRDGDRELLGWWAVDPASGSYRGFVASEAGPAQGTLTWLSARDPHDLGSVLSSLPDLHAAARWLIATADQGLAALRPRACAATALVADLLAAGAPADWPAPDFDGLCAVRPGEATARPFGAAAGVVLLPGRSPAWGRTDRAQDLLAAADAELERR